LCPQFYKGGHNHLGKSYDLFNAFSGKWVYIRFNPDKFRTTAGVSKNPTIATRLIELKTEIERQIQRIEAEENTDLLEIRYMYYDGYM